ncbi:HPr family phosphocarrier protein [Demequina globuliformis]|uniref:HPr family phosphocarrier protein n=1 Tax=Demequina globuliformis TaxID=676202 RepID=UPI000781AEC0|nr:HPr family phosphocarrier protein [Demequina globuliformis]
MERTVTVAIEEGLHARPAALFVAAAQEAPADVTISTGGEPVPADSILSIMTLGAKAGDTVTLATEGDSDDDAAALDSLEAFLQQKVVS